MHHAPDASPEAPPPLFFLRSHVAAGSAERHSSANLNFVIVTASLLALLLLVLLLNIFFRILLRKFVSSQDNVSPPCRLHKAQLDALIPTVLFNPTMSAFTPPFAPSPHKSTSTPSKMSPFTPSSASPLKTATPHMSGFQCPTFPNPLPNPTPHVLTPLPRIGRLHHHTNQTSSATVVVVDPCNPSPNIPINILPDHHLDANLEHPYNSPCHDSPNRKPHLVARLMPLPPPRPFPIPLDHHLDANLDHPYNPSPIHPYHHLDANLDHPCNPSPIHPDHHLDANLDHSSLVIDPCPNLFTHPHHHLHANLDINVHADSECAICLLPFRLLDVLRIMPKCMHRFHASCIDTWLALNSSCPICRHDILDSAPFQPERRPTH